LRPTFLIFQDNSEFPLFTSFYYDLWSEIWTCLKYIIPELSSILSYRVLKENSMVKLLWVFEKSFGFHLSSFRIKANFNSDHMSRIFDSYRMFLNYPLLIQYLTQIVKCCILSINTKKRDFIAVTHYSATYSLRYFGYSSKILSQPQLMEYLSLFPSRRVSPESFHLEEWICFQFQIK
jgi:hypothetical protein